MTKTLFVLVADCGDGSSSAKYTMNAEWVKAREALNLDYGALGFDGDGFHYDTIELPDECTYESLTISDCSEGRADGYTDKWEAEDNL
jgi:hypothetical protein